VTLERVTLERVTAEAVAAEAVTAEAVTARRNRGAAHEDFPSRCPAAVISALGGCLTFPS
jgi:hypothetical protein